MRGVILGVCGMGGGKEALDTTVISRWGGVACGIGDGDGIVVIGCLLIGNGLKGVGGIGDILCRSPICGAPFWATRALSGRLEKMLPPERKDEGIIK